MLSNDSFLSLYVIHVIGQETFRKDNPGFKCLDINCEESSEVFFFRLKLHWLHFPLTHLYFTYHGGKKSMGSQPE